MRTISRLLSCHWFAAKPASADDEQSDQTALQRDSGGTVRLDPGPGKSKRRMSLELQKRLDYLDTLKDWASGTAPHSTDGRARKQATKAKVDARMALENWLKSSDTAALDLSGLQLETLPPLPDNVVTVIFTGNGLGSWSVFTRKPAALQELDLSKNFLQLETLTNQYIRSIPAGLALLFNDYHISAQGGVRKLANVTAGSSRKPGGTSRDDGVAGPPRRSVGPSDDRPGHDGFVAAAPGPAYDRTRASPAGESLTAVSRGTYAAGRKRTSVQYQAQQTNARSDNPANNGDAAANRILDNEEASKLLQVVSNKNWEYLMQALAADRGLANAGDGQGLTLLHHAVRENYPELVDHLLEMSGIVVNAQDNYRRNPLHYAVMCGNTVLATKLVATGRKLGQALGNADFRKKTPLHHAAEGNRIVLIELLLSVADANINEPDDDDNTPLTYALGFQDRRCLQTLLSSPLSDVNAPVRQRNTPLIIAISHRYPGGARLLLKHERINANARNENGFTALHTAVTLNKRHIVSLLAGCAKTDINLTDNNRMTPLHHAIKEGYFEIAAKLVEARKINMNVADVMGRTPLHDAVSLGRFDFVELLLLQDRTAVNQRDVNGFTPLHYAAYGETIECAAITLALLSHPAIDVEIKNAEGTTAYGLAKRYHNHTFINTYSKWARSRNAGHNAPGSRSHRIPRRKSSDTRQANKALEDAKAFLNFQPTDELNRQSLKEKLRAARLSCHPEENPGQEEETTEKLKK